MTKWISIIMIISCTFAKASDEIIKSYIINVPHGTISIGIPKGWSLGYIPPPQAITFQPSEEKKRMRLGGEAVLTIHKKQSFLSGVAYRASVAIYYKSNPDEPYNWDELLEFWRTDRGLASRFADGVTRFIFKPAQKRTIDGIEFYFLQSAYDKYTEIPVKDGGTLLVTPSDWYYMVVPMAGTEYLLNVSINYLDDKYYNEKNKTGIERDVARLFKSFRFQPDNSK